MTTRLLCWCDSTNAFHTSPPQIQLNPFYSNTPGRNTHGPLFPTHPSASHPSCYTHKMTGGTNVSPLAFKPLCCMALIYTSELCLNSLSTSLILSHRNTETCVRKNMTGTFSAEPSGGSERCGVSRRWAALSLCVFLLGSLSVHRTNLIMSHYEHFFFFLKKGQKKMLVNHKLIKRWFSHAAPQCQTNCGRTCVCKRMDVFV